MQPRRSGCSDTTGISWDITNTMSRVCLAISYIDLYSFSRGIETFVVELMRKIIVFRVDFMFRTAPTSYSYC